MASSEDRNNFLNGIGEVRDDWRMGRGARRYSYPLFCLTSTMSHDGSGRDSCFGTFSGTMLHFEVPEAARGVTDVDVGSGALLGKADEARESVQSRFNSGTPKRPSK